MGLGRYLEGAPKRDPQYVLPPEPDEVPDYAYRERMDSSARRLWIAAGLIGSAIIGGVVVVVANNPEGAPKVIAEASTSAPQATPETTSASPSPSPSESASQSPTPSPTHTKTASPSPTRTSASPTPTKTHVVIPAPSTPAAKTEAPASGICHVNPNAASSPYNAREIICNDNVPVYKNSDGTDEIFEINGPAQVDCINAEGPYVPAEISNGNGWISLNNFGTDVCN